MFHRPRTTTAGFTLVELLVAIVVLGILAALTVPALRAAQARTRDGVAVAEFASLGRAAAAYAAADEASLPDRPAFTAVIDAGSHTRWTEARTPDGDDTAPAPTTVVVDPQAGRTLFVSGVPHRSSRYVLAGVVRTPMVTVSLVDLEDLPAAAGLGTSQQRRELADEVERTGDAELITPPSLSYAGPWETATTTLPEPVAFAAAVRLPDGTVLMTGGVTDDGPTAASWLLSDTDSQPAPSLPSPRFEHAMVATATGQVWVIGGLDTDGNPLASVLTWEPGQGSWVEIEPLPSARHGATATLAGSTIFLIGDGPLLSYNTASVFGSWQEPSLAQQLEPHPTRHATTVGSDGRVYVTGGFNQIGMPLDRVAVFDPADPSAGFRLDAVPPLPAPRYNHTLTATGPLLIVTGGQDAWNDALDTTLMLDLTALQNGWVSGPPLNLARSGHSATADLTGRIWVLGGSQPGLGTPTRLDQVEQLGTTP